MKTSILVIFATLLSSNLVSASTKLTCEPSKKNNYFTDSVELVVVSGKTIQVNGIKLKLDPSYEARYKTDYERYVGKTDEATQWSDSGSTEVFYNGDSKLKFTIRGEMFISETFTCE